MKISPDFDLMFPEIEKFEFTTYVTGYWGLFQAGRVLKPLINPICLILIFLYIPKTIMT